MLIRFRVIISFMMIMMLAVAGINSSLYLPADYSTVQSEYLPGGSSLEEPPDGVPSEGLTEEASGTPEETLHQEVEPATALADSSPPQPTPTNAQPPRQSGSQVADLAETDTDLNPYVLKVLKSYQGQSFPYLLNSDYANYNGVTQNIYYQGQLLLRAHPSGNRASHCVGLTFEVFFKAMQARNIALGLSPEDFNGMTPEELFDFILTWYVAKGSKPVSNLSVAVEQYGLGRRIHSWEEAKAGDFIDFSRTNGTGHAGVFIEWVRTGGRIIGFRYWSTQGSTGGISYNTEYFSLLNESGQRYGNVIMDPIYIARIGPVSAYRSFR